MLGVFVCVHEGSRVRVLYLRPGGEFPPPVPADFPRVTLEMKSPWNTNAVPNHTQTHSHTHTHKHTHTLTHTQTHSDTHTHISRVIEM